MERRDIPIETLKEDEFGISRYVNALCEFIRNSESPVTIALQGEWGSGKSSFMKIIENTLCSASLPEEERFEAIWLNTWELFLENDFELAVKKLLINLLEQMEVHFEKLDNVKKGEKRKEIIKDYLRSFSNATLSAVKLDNEFSEKMVDRIFSNDSGSKAVSRIKKEFESFLVNEVEQKGNHVTDKAFLIFVDDLDRLDPKMAVTLLEALKNLFDIRKCIFILAIDYEVVASGVEQKYGRKVIKDRNIAKDFFDKMIQVPYVIPMSQYKIDSMVLDRLRLIPFFEREYDYVKFGQIIVEIVTLATNKNPRTIKRLINMLQLAMALEDRTEYHHGSFRVMELFLMALQLSFPDVYNMLVRSSDLETWKKSIYVSGQRKISQQEREKYKLDEEWKEVIFLAMAEDEVARKNYYRIAGLLEIYERIQSRCRKVDEKVQDALGVVSVIRAQSGDNAQIRYDGENYDKSSQTQFRQGEHLLDRLELSNYENVLDVGCGSGNTTLEMWEKNMDMHIDAIDISAAQIEKSKENYMKTLEQYKGQDYQGSVNFYVLDALELSQKNQYDLVFSNATLHWIMKPHKMYELLFQSLVPGGKLAVHQGGEGTYKELHGAVRKAAENTGLDGKLKNWLFPAYYPPKEEIEELLQSIGFENVEVESIHKDESNNEHLVDNFATASLIFYKKAGLTDDELKKKKKEYFRLCSEEKIKMSSHRLYIFANRPNDK